MNKKLPYILTTLIGFIVGTAAGVWVMRTPPIPAPPAAVLGEIKDASLGAETPAAVAGLDPATQAAYAQIRAEMDEFKKKVDAIKATLRAEMDVLLTDEQREVLKRSRERPPAPPSPTPVATTGQALPARPTARHFYEGFDSTITIIMVPYSLERIDADLRLTPAQKAAVLKLLIERRARFLELVDTTPPPSFKLIKLVPPEAQGQVREQGKGK